MSREESFLVIGGSGGIGAATCCALAEAGFRPIVTFARNGPRAREVVARCGGTPLHLDLQDDHSIDAAVNEIVTAHVPLAGVVNAAAPLPEIVPFTRISAPELEHHWRVSVMGPQRLLSSLLRHCFIKRKQGTIVAVLSAAMGDNGVATLRNLGSYIVAKYGHAGLLAVLAAEYPWLRVRCVRPSYTDTPMLAAFDDRFIALQREQGRLSSPTEVAAGILREILRP